MRSFKDNKSRSWEVDVNVATLRRVRDKLGVNLYELADPTADIVSRLFGDPILLCDVLFVLVSDQAERSGISDEDFGRSLAGDAFEHAADALWDAVVDFFPNPRIREALQRIAEKGRALQPAILERMLAETDRITPEMVLAVPTSRIGSRKTSGASRGSSESTPGR